MTYNTDDTSGEGGESNLTPGQTALDAAAKAYQLAHETIAMEQAAAAREAANIPPNIGSMDTPAIESTYNPADPSDPFAGMSAKKALQSIHAAAVSEGATHDDAMALAINYSSRQAMKGDPRFIHRDAHGA